jgi:hypothetical protein
MWTRPMRPAGLLAGWLVLSPLAAPAQTPSSPPSERGASPELAPPSFRDELKLFAYVEQSFTWNATGAGRGGVNELRVYDDREGFTFGMAELSVKKDPTERYPFGFGLVVAAGRDAQKNHSLGIFRDEDDQFPFRNTPLFDLQEAYLSVRIPLGAGILVKAGKWVSLLGYEVIESPSNLNFSRGVLFNLAGPFTHTGGLVSYAVTSWLTGQIGVVTGSDTSEDTNTAPSVTGGFVLQPLKELAVNVVTLVGPEQNDNDSHQRWILDAVAVYTGLAGLTLAGEITGGRESREPSVVASGTRRDPDASWWGWGLWGAYDFTERLRLALRQEYFKDAQGARTGFGAKVSLRSTTVTLQYRLWRGWVGRLEYRHDRADAKVFRARYDENRALALTSKSLDTLSVSMYYTFF